MWIENQNAITALDGAVAVGGAVTVAQLLEDPLLWQEARPVAEAVRRDVEAGLLSPDQTAEALLRQDVRCPSREQGAPCLLAGERACPSLETPCPAGSVMGGKRLEPPACQAACPAGVDLAGILQLLREGSLLEAQRTLMKYLPMARTVCRACGRCAGACVKSQPVGLHQLMDWLGDTIDSHPEIFFIPPSGDSRKWVALPSPTLAALSAAYYLRRMGNHVVVLNDGPAEESLAPFGERALPLAHRLALYKENLAAMGVLFSPGSLTAWAGEPFHHVLDLESAPANGWDQLVPAIAWGVEEARKLNLSYGLKSFLEPGGDFCTFQREGLSRPPVGEIRDEAQALAEAGRCLNCACYGASGGCASAALLMLETVIRTDRRTLRAQDYFAQLQPWRQFQPGEELEALEIPMCGDFRAGCLSQGELCLCYAFLVEEGKAAILRLTAGGAAPVPVRLSAGERALQGQPLLELEPGQAARQVMEAIEPSLCLPQGGEKKLHALEGLLEQCITAVQSV